MSDNDTGKAASWTDRELLVYLLSTIEYSNAKLDYANAPAPAGRNASGCAQIIMKLTKALKKDIEALKNGTAIGDTKPTKGKRKADDGEEKPRKRGRPKKAVKSEQKIKEDAAAESGGMNAGGDAEEEEV